MMVHLQMEQGHDRFEIIGRVDYFGCSKYTASVGIPRRRIRKEVDLYANKTKT